jgi:hypothetical protein
MTQIVRLAGAANYLVIGEVTGIHLRDDCLVDGIFDVTRASTRRAAGLPRLHGGARHLHPGPPDDR